MSADVAYATEQVAKYEAPPTFVSPGSPFDIAKVKGKTIAVIPDTTNEYEDTIEAGMRSLAAKYGVGYKEYPTQGEPTQWVSAMKEALAANPSAIVLNDALDPTQVLPEVEQAKARGIPVIATHFYDQTYSESLRTKCGATAALCNDGLTATVDAPFDEATRVEADWIIANSDAKADVLVITANDAAPSAGMAAAAKAEFARYCPQCKVTFSNVLASNWPTQIPSLVSTSLARDPSLDYIMPLFDFGAPYAADGIATAGKTGKVKIVSYNGTVAALTLLEKHDGVAADVGEPANWLAAAFMDQIFRVLAGVPPVADEHTPIRLFTSSNVELTGVPPTVAGGYSGAYVKGYAALWMDK